MRLPTRRVVTLLLTIIVLQWLLIAALVPGLASAAPYAGGDIEMVETLAHQAQSAATLATVISIVALVIALASLLALLALTFNPSRAEGKAAE